LRKPIFAKGFGEFHRNPIGFLQKLCFFEKKFANIFAMSAALSPWGKGFKSRFLGKLKICGIFHCIPRKSCFLTTPPSTPWAGTKPTKFGVIWPTISMFAK
jgi:hypothetical protein